jgi:gluconokinase
VTGPHVVVSGVSGSGKSTVGTALSQRLRIPFEDGDDLHPQANIDKMSAGVPLDDGDRRPWLLEIGRWLADRPDGGVIACSALKRSYRDLIRHACPGAWMVQLVGDHALIIERQRTRKGHFMPPGLMHSQFTTLEALQPDEDGMSVEVSEGVPVLVERIARALELEHGDA